MVHNNKYFSLSIRWLSECREWEIFRQLQRAAKIHGNRKLKTTKKWRRSQTESKKRNMANDQQEIFWDLIRCVVLLLSSSRCESRSLFLTFDVQKPNRSTKNVHVKSNLSDNECHKILKRLIESCKKVFFLSSLVFGCCMPSIQRAIALKHKQINVSRALCETLL